MIPPELVERMLTDRKVRVAITKQSHWYFLHFYFPHYIQYATAEFQKEMIRLTESDAVKNIFIVSFRGSGKSTIVTTSFPLWAILGRQRLKFVLILCQTKSQAKQHMMNLRQELENNPILKGDLGPFYEESDEWGSGSIVFSKYNARITVASTEQSIRGLRHNQHRPELIICDDVEDIASTKTMEGRQKTYQWLTGEVIPAGDKNTRLIVIGNLLHEDSLLMKLKNDVAIGSLDGEYREFPLVDDNNNILWPGKYPTMEDIGMEKKKIGNEISWQREYLLRIIPSDDQVIHPDWIQYYNELPPKTHKAYRCTYAAVDLAISQKESADYTAIVSAMVFGRADKLRIYILPNPIIKKLSFPEQTDLLKSFTATALDDAHDQLFVEGGTGYQDALPQTLQALGIKVTTVRPVGDKRTRLALTAPLLKSGRVRFPRIGAEEIIRQMVNLGVEKHDDAADAFSLLVNKIAEIHSRESTVIFMSLDLGGSDDTIIYSSDYVDVEKE